MRKLISLTFIILFLLCVTRCSKQEPELWRNAYAEFLRKDTFSNDNGLIFEFSLRDLDADGTPELLLLQSDENALNAALTVYGYKETVYKMGDYANLKKSFITGFCVSSNTMFPGLFECWSGGGEEHYGYLTLSDGKLGYEYLWRNDRTNEPPEQTLFSNNERLIAESINMFTPDNYSENLLEIYILNESNIKTKLLK